MRTLQQWAVATIATCFRAPCLVAQVYPVVAPLQTKVTVSDVSSADVSLEIRSLDGAALYKLQCHSAGYTGDPDFDYSGDFECRLSSVGRQEGYSTLLTDNPRQTRDWESRGRFLPPVSGGGVRRCLTLGRLGLFDCEE